MSRLNIIALFDLRHTAIKLAVWAIILLLSHSIPSAHAALGEHVPTAQMLNAVSAPPAPTNNGSPYRVITGTDRSGLITIRQYINNNNVVFGIAWDGPIMPDLSQLLGSYFPNFQTALSNQSNLRNTRQISTGNLVIHQNGHMRHYMGNAWDPSLLPAGVTGREIQ